MKGLKCYILLSVLFIMLGLSLSVCSDTSALQHEYRGIPLSSPSLPPLSLGSDGKYYLDFTQTANISTATSVAYPFTIQFQGDSDVSVNDLNILYSSSYFSPELINGQCVRNGTSILPIFSFGSDFVSAQLPSYFPEKWSQFSGNAKCLRFQKFGDGSVPPFDMDSLPIGNLTCNKQNGAVCGGIWNSSDYFQNEILPYWFSQNGLIMQSHAIDSDSGIHYNNSFSLSNVFGQTIPRFSYLQVPLWDNDSDYFYTPSNLYQSRHFDFNAAFEFDGSFAWHSDIENNGSYFRVRVSGATASDGYVDDVFAQCTTNLITLENLTRLEFSCPIDLPHDFLSLFPVLEISGNGNYVFNTDSNWRFAYTYLTTDYDTTPGASFNSNITGGGSKFFGDAANSITSGDADWFSSLKDLFSFDFLNPFLPIFGLFSDSESCASIPTLAGMLHSNETSVCPWFPSSVRDILTPVLGLSGMMLSFGFAVKWLGSDFGNIVDDESSIAPPSRLPAGARGTKRVGWRRKGY